MDFRVSSSYFKVEIDGGQVLSVDILMTAVGETPTNSANSPQRWD